MARDFSADAHEFNPLPTPKPLELWGGHECTVNRVGDRWFDQTIRTGHQDRPSDLTRFAEIGFKALRYPVLWERISPDRPDAHDWRWTDERLHEIRRLGMKPIAGLVHHGSGPHYTHLLDESFAPGLAAHAAAVAERYPWIEAYTPVNEPLTTARFSALYGHWYPHARDEWAFMSALLNEIDATRLSMRAIRRVNPTARLLQTEDLGHVFATAPLQAQADFENERRWLCWDLLCGMVGPGHHAFERFEWLGLGDRVRAIADDPCPPDVLGVNHYLSSERFLDHRVERYPADKRGGNYETPYCDVEAVRAVAPGPMGIERLLEAAWERYRIPLAVTESHNGCSRDEQMRWAHEAWTAAGRLRARGVPVEAVTIWSLLGSIDWNSLLTRDNHHYEVGVFDIRGPEPRPTGMVELCRRLAHGEPETQPALDGPGWWSRDIRYAYAPTWVGAAPPVHRRWQAAPAAQRPLLITGATGTLGRAFAKACEHRGLAYALTDRGELSLDSEASITEALESIEPWAVINAAGYVRVDEAERDRAACLSANAEGPARLAAACAAAGLPMVNFSSDLVFDGRKGSPYVESDAPRPLNVYGESKALAEAAMAEVGVAGLTIRTAAFFSADDPHNFADAVVRTLARGERFVAASDAVVSPTLVHDLVTATLDLLIDGERGVWHLANKGQASWAEFARKIARACGLDARLVRSVPAATMGWSAEQPRSVVLLSERGDVMPSLDDAVARYAGAMRERLPERLMDRRAKPAAVARPEPVFSLGEPRSFAPV